MKQKPQQPNNMPAGEVGQTTQQLILAYIPVLHQGYLDFFARHKRAKTLLLIGPEFTSHYRSMQKDLRALKPEQIKASVEALELFDTVEIVENGDFQLTTYNFQLVSPDEDETRDFIAKFLPNANVEYDGVFLRWDKTKTVSGRDVELDVEISRDEFDQQMMNLAYESAAKSSDWWRQTAAVLVKDKKVIAVARNTHVPQDYQQYVDGEPRAQFGKGEHIDLSSAYHAEATVIVEAARKGISTEGCWLYATTFPCPYCAPIVANSGIKKIFYSEGYAMIEGDKTLKSKGVEIYKVTNKSE